MWWAQDLAVHLEPRIQAKVEEAKLCVFQAPLSPNLMDLWACPPAWVGDQVVGAVTTTASARLDRETPSLIPMAIAYALSPITSAPQGQAQEVGSPPSRKDLRMLHQPRPPLCIHTTKYHQGNHSAAYRWPCLLLTIPVRVCRHLQQPDALAINILRSRSQTNCSTSEDLYLPCTNGNLQLHACSQWDYPTLP